MTKVTKRIISIATILIVISLILSGCQFIQVDPEVDANTVVAEVAGEEIKKAEFTTVYESYKAYYDTQLGKEVWDQEIDGKKYIDVFKEKVLDIVIDTRIQMNKAKELGITVTEEEIEAEINKVREYFDTEEQFNEYLTSSNITLEKFKEDKSIELTINKLREKLTEGITVTDEDVAIYYTTNADEFISVKASHILVDTIEEARDMIAKINEGKDFNELAKEFSKDPSAKQNAGDLDYFRLGDMVEPFEKAAFALKPGEISEPVETQFGFHVIKVEDRKNERLEDVADDIKASLLEEKKYNEYMTKLEEMRTAANIKKFVKGL